MWTSVSSVTRFVEACGGCERQWSGGYIYDEWPEQTVEQGDGDELHGQVEHHLSRGVRLDLSSPMGFLAFMGMQYWPDKSDAPLVEQVIDVEFGPHVYKRNKIDILHNSPAGPVVTDHKKVKGMRYRLNKAGLRADLAFNVYGYHAMKRFGTEHVHGCWIYYDAALASTMTYAQWRELSKEEQEKFRAKCVPPPTEVTIDMEDAKAVLNHFSPHIDRMARLKDRRDQILRDIGAPYKGLTPEHKAELKRRLPFLNQKANYDACEKYSGCTQYAEVCGVTLRERGKKA